MATHYSILDWRIPWTEEPGGLQSMGSQELDMTSTTTKGQKWILKPVGWHIKQTAFPETHKAGLKMGTPREFMTGFPCQMSASLMNKIVQKNPQLDPFVYMDDSSMNFQDDSQIPVGPTKWKKSHGCTSFILIHTQYVELEFLFSCNMFPGKIPQRDFALKLSLLESTEKICFKNWWIKMMKQQQ